MGEVMQILEAERKAGREEGFHKGQLQGLREAKKIAEAQNESM